MTKETKNFQVINALICDDVRKEANGKDILIGVYSGNISVKKVPANIMLSAWINLQIEEPGEFNFEVRVIDPSGRTIVDGKIGLKAKEKHDTASISLPKFSIMAQSMGKLKVQIRKRGGRWQTIISKDLVIGVLPAEKSD